MVNRGVVKVLLPILALASTLAAAPAKGPGPKDLILSIDTGRRSAALFEPVVLQYRVTNPTDAPIRSRVRMQFEEGGLSVFLQQDQTPPTPFHTGPIMDVLDLGEGTLLQPGETLSADVVIFDNSGTKEPAFPTPGRYTISADLITDFEAGVAVRVKATPISLLVEPPSTADREVIANLGSEAELIDLFSAGAVTYCAVSGAAGGTGQGVDQGIDDCYGRLRQLVEVYPDSAYAPAVAYNIGAAYAHLGRKDPAKRQDAIDALTGFLSRWEDHPLAADAAWTLIWTLDKAGRTQKLIDWLDRFDQQFPDRAHKARSLRQRVRPILNPD